MADTTYEKLWKLLQVYAPDLPSALAKTFINDAYSEVLGNGFRYSGLRRSGVLDIPAPYNTGTVAITYQSTTVTGTSTVWTSAMVGRQFFINGTSPFYEIASVESATSLTLTYAFAETTVTADTYEISKIFIDTPSNFHQWNYIVDTVNNWKLRTGLLRETLSVWDPDRSTSGTPRALAPVSPHATTGLPRYELWPRVSAQKHYPIEYFIKPDLMSAAADTPIFIVRGAIIREGALAKLALWPGVEGKKNPYYNIDAHRRHEEKFQDLMALAETEDEAIQNTRVRYAGDFSDVPWAPIDAAYLQGHDVSHFRFNV